MNTNTTQAKSKKVLSSGFTLAVTIGGIIGLGILRTPGEVASAAPEPFLFVSLWILGGLFILLSTVVAAELVGMTPRSGGSYSLVRRAYGPFPGFVIGWVDWLSFVSDIALKAVVVTEFATMLVPSLDPWQLPLSILVSTFFAALQLLGLGLGAKIQQYAAASIAIIVIGFSLALLFAGTDISGNEILSGRNDFHVGSWSLVIAAIIYTYDGWLYAAYFSGEVRGGGKAVIKASIRGVIIVIVLYAFLTSALAWKVPLDSIAGSELALARALEIAVSPLASTIVLLSAIIITLAHQNVLYMSTPRILQAMAVDGLAVKRASVISKGGNPIFAVLISWGLSVGLIIIGGFEFLLHLSVFFHIFVYVLLIAGVLILRIRQADADRPYRAWGHPWSTMICLLGWALLTLFQTIAEIETALYAGILVLISWPVYSIIIRSRKK